MESSAEQASLPTEFTPKKKPKKLGGIVKLGGSEKIRYQALRRLKVPSEEAVKLAKKTFAELREMGYKFGSLQCKPGEKPVLRTSKAKEIRSQRSRHDALKKIGVMTNLKQLSKKSFAELKQMRFKFLPQKLGKKPVNGSFKKQSGYAPEIPRANEIPIQHAPKQSHSEILPAERPQHGSIRVGIKDANPMTDSQLETLSYTILEKIAGMPQGEGPRFKGYSRKPGWLLITCADQRSKDWLEELIPSLKPWPEASLELIPESELPKPNIATVFIPNTDTTMIEQSLSLIRAQNALDTELWKVLNSKAQKGGVILTLSLDSQSVGNLQKNDLKANLGFREVQFRLKGLKAQQSGTDFRASNPLSLDQNLPGTSSFDATLAPARNIFPIRANSIQPPPRKSCMNLDSPPSVGDKEIENREVTRIHQRYPSTVSCRGKEDIISDIDGGTSCSGREDFNVGASFSKDVRRDSHGGSREDIEGGDSYCGEEDIMQEFAEGTSYNDREDINRAFSYTNGEDIDRASSNNGREDIRGDIDECSGNSGREYINRGASYTAREDIRENMAGGFSHSVREYVNRAAGYSGRNDNKRDTHGGSNYIDREVMGRDIQRGVYGGTNYRNFDNTRREINQDNRYRGREDIRTDMNRSASNIGREAITSYIGREDSTRDISGGIRYSDKGATEVIRCNQITQYNHKSSINDDISGFRKGSTGSFRDRDIGEDIGGLKKGITSFGVKGDGQIHQHFAGSTRSYRDRDIGENFGGINRETREFRGRGGSQIHQRFPPSTSSYRDIGKDIREFNDGTSFGSKKDSQIQHQFPPTTESYKDRNFGEDNGGVNKGIFVGRSESQLQESSSHWGSSDIKSMGRGYSRGSHGCTAGVMQGDPQSYTRDVRGYTTVGNQRYTRRDDYGYAKGNQC